jgi:AhpD family alkylhydroperoxidase
MLDRIPDDVIDNESTLFKRYELDETPIPNKYRELIGIAVHSETKCRYYTLFHTEAAKMFGATDEEIQERAPTRSTPWGRARTSTAPSRTTTSTPGTSRRSAST